MAFDIPRDVNPMPILEPDCSCAQSERLTCIACVALAPPGSRCGCTHEAGDSACAIHDALKEDARAALASTPRGGGE